MAEFIAPIQTLSEASSRNCFNALMWALSYPGRPKLLPTSADYALGVRGDMLAIGHTLLDLETSFFANDAALAFELDNTSARARPIDCAAYVFLPQLRPEDLHLLEQVDVGDAVYPDRGATLIIGCTFAAANSVELEFTGPGINGTQAAHIGGVAYGFWAMRQHMLRYPLGFDVFFVGEGQVLGLPRTTHVAVYGAIDTIPQSPIPNP
jgi:alpha-D-ribose 1-methylphosphonate 5-triphosphate synthase subunit PhnH